MPEEILRRPPDDRARLEPGAGGVFVHTVAAVRAEPSASRAVRTRRGGRGDGRPREGARDAARARPRSSAGSPSQLAAGELSALTGPSGSGKSTLLHLLAGLDLPTAGDVRILGTPLSGLDDTGRALLRRERIGLVTQGTDLVPFLTAQETVELALALRGVARDEALARADRSLAAVGLGELAGQRVARLSMGERQRVALARALAARPAMLLADEPTARLDEANARAVGALFAELARTTGTAIVCATHDPVLIEHAQAEVSAR